MNGTDHVQGPALTREARAVLLEVDRMATARRDIDPPTADLLSRVHEDLLALIDLLEQGRTPGDSASPGTSAWNPAGSPGCRALPGEI